VPAPFAVNPHRFDPYKDFKFRVFWDGQAISGISRVSALRRWTEVVVHRQGGDPSLQRRSPGLTAFEPIVLERGITHDPAFEAWADAVWKLGAGLGQEVKLKTFRKDVRIELLNEAGQVVRAYVVHRCWPSEYQALPDLDTAQPTEVAIERLTLQHEGWERDLSVTEPAEP
jgi:phage tail-like protein